MIYFFPFQRYKGQILILSTSILVMIFYIRPSYSQSRLLSARYLTNLKANYEFSIKRAFGQLDDKKEETNKLLKMAQELANENGIKTEIQHHFLKYPALKILQEGESL